MTIKKAFKLRGIEYPEGIKPTYDIDFINNDGEHDETQFTVTSISTAVQELEDFLKSFCFENGFRSMRKITSITSVAPN